MSGVDIKILHTGQHYDKSMSDVFFQELEIQKPDYFLGADGDGQIEVLSDIMVKFEKKLKEYDPDIVLVPGDVNSSLACALVSSRLGYKLGHIESGLRSRDRNMPEEINRILIDKLSDMFFVTEQGGVDNLLSEGHGVDNIHFVGNTMIDTLVSFSDKIDEHAINPSGDYCLSTFHRPSNVDNQESLEKIISVFKGLTNSGLDVIIPLHPRTKKNFIKFNLFDELCSISGLTLLDSLGYLSFMSLVKNASVVVTDSGGIQEETTFLQVPCITVRENTERPSTIELGTNVLVELDVGKVCQAVSLRDKLKAGSVIPPMWDGASTERILNIILEELNKE